MKPFFKAVFTLAVALISTAPASADSNAATWAGTPVFTVIDLDPGDGVTPTFTWIPVRSEHLLNAYDSGTDDSAAVLELLGVNGLIQRNAAIPRAQAGSTVNAEPNGLRATAGASNMWSNPATSGASSVVGLSGGFTLVGKGSVQITLPYTLEVGGLCLQSGCNIANSLVGFVSRYGNEEYLRTSELGYNGVLTARSGELSSIDIRNFSSVTPLTGEFFYSAHAFTSGDTVPVPEPEVWAMLLSGLALVGLMTRRRLGAK